MKLAVTQAARLHGTWAGPLEEAELLCAQVSSYMYNWPLAWLIAATPRVFFDKMYLYNSVELKYQKTW